MTRRVNDLVGTLRPHRGKVEATPPTPPTAPVITATTVDYSQISITLTTPATGPSGIGSYQLEWSPNGTSGWASLTASATFPYIHAGLSPVTTYYYRATATGASPSAVVGPYSSNTSATTSAAPGFSWPIQTPGYITALNNHSGYGMDSTGGSGRDGTEGRVRVFFMNWFTADDPNVSGASSTNPITITCATAHGRASGDVVQIYSLPGSFAALNGNNYTITVLNSTQFTVAVNGSGFTAYTSGGIVHGAICHAIAGKTRFYKGNAEGLITLRNGQPLACYPTKPGYVNLGADWRPGSNFDYYGQYAPGDGTIFRGTVPQVVEAFSGAYPTSNKQRWWHLDCRPGDDAGGIDPSNRDGFDGGAVGSDGSYPVPTQNIFINCFFGWSIDEIWEAYSGLDLTTFLYTLFGEALHKSLNLKDISGVPTYVSHGFGGIIGGGRRSDRVCYSRCMHAHMAGRQPMIAALKFAYANNIVYNMGDNSGSTPQVVRLTNDYELYPANNTAAMYSNIVGNVFIAGPNTPASVFMISVDPGGVDPTTQLPAGSQGYISKNVVVGLTYANQLAMKSGTFPGSFDAGALLTSAWPQGWRTDLGGIVDIDPSATNPNSFDTAKVTAFVQQLCAVLGPRPNKTGAYSRARTIANHAVAAMLGTGDMGQCVNSVSGTSNQASWPTGVASGTRYGPNAGGWPTLTGSEVDPFSPGGEWHAAFPLNGTAPDDRVLVTGEFAGKTAIEAHGILQHRFRGGV